MGSAPLPGRRRPLPQAQVPPAVAAGPAASAPAAAPARELRDEEQVLGLRDEGQPLGLRAEEVADGSASTGASSSDTRDAPPAAPSGTPGDLGPPRVLGRYTVKGKWVDSLWRQYKLGRGTL